MVLAATVEANNLLRLRTKLGLHQTSIVPEPERSIYPNQSSSQTAGSAGKAAGRRLQ
jgi:hypothetical protein